MQTPCSTGARKNETTKAELDRFEKDMLADSPDLLRLVAQSGFRPMSQSRALAAVLEKG